jgi:hypothetical protein
MGGALLPGRRRKLRRRFKGGRGGIANGARICKRLKRPEIDSASLCSLRAGTSNRIVLPTGQADNRFLGSPRKVYKYGLRAFRGENYILCPPSLNIPDVPAFVPYPSILVVPDVQAVLKGLSHQMDLAFEDMLGQF